MTAAEKQLLDGMKQSYGADSVVSYSEYLAEQLDLSISYSEYLGEQINHTITQQYAEWALDNVSEDTVDYSAYVADTIKYSMNGYEAHYLSSHGVHVPDPHGPLLYPLFTYDLVTDPGFGGAMLYSPLVPDPNNPFDCDDD